MKHRTNRGAWETTLASPARLTLLIALWFAALASVPLHNHFEAPGWDVSIYLQGVDSVHHGRDPYADAIARQQAFHKAQNSGETGPTPYSYVYGPITLPALRLVGAMPLWISGVLYWSLYLAGVLAQLWVTFTFALERERLVFIFFLPAAVFFPGLLASDIAWSGNIAFILYGAALAAAMIGWKHGRWALFYATVVFASCFKAPMLSLLAIPVLSGKNQRVWSGLAALAGLAVFLMQPLLMPQLFHHYLQAVELQFSYNRDFGSGPAGLFSGFLFDHHHAYAPAAYIFYAAYALPLVATLFYLSQRFFAGRLTLSQWAPTLLLGTVLLNPRILEYDEILLFFPIALILWRFFRSMASFRAALALSVATFALANGIAYQSWLVWKQTEGVVLVCSFAAGAWTLFQASRQAQYQLSEQTPLSAA